MKTIDQIISYMENTTEESWCEKKVRVGITNCFFGHLFNMEEDEKEANRLWDMFEEVWATTYMIYPVNDWEHIAYQQDNPKDRIVAYLGDLRDWKSMTTRDYLEEQEQLITN